MRRSAATALGSVLLVALAAASAMPAAAESGWLAPHPPKGKGEIKVDLVVDAKKLPGLHTPNGVAMDGQAHVLLADAGTGTLYRVKLADGSHEKVASSPRCLLMLASMILVPKPFVVGALTRGPPVSSQRSVNFASQSDQARSTCPVPPESAPYLAAFVANSWTIRATDCALSGGKIIAEPLRVARRPSPP